MGFSLIELLLVLAIIAALAVAAFIVYPKIQAANAAKHEAEIITSAVATLRNIYASGNYSTLNERVATDAKIFPDTMIVADGVIQNRWGGSVFVGSSFRSPKLLRIDYNDVPADVCMKLVPILAQSFQGVRILPNEGDGYIIREELNGVGNTGSTYYQQIDERKIAEGCRANSGKAGQIAIYDF